MAVPESPHTRSTALWLFLFFVAALTLRIAFSVEVGFDDDSQRHLFTGNDPYYHHHALSYLLETGESLVFDPLINYPEGGYNPNPPLYVWTAAPVALIADAMGAADPAGVAINVMTGVWGALTLFPVFILARDLWGRRAGLWAAFFTAISAPHIQRSVWGYADHDSISMFFITLAFVFMVKALRALRAREYVARWTSTEAVAGVRTAVRENRDAFLYAILAGLALTATALVWKGYAYALAVMAVALTIQLLADHLRGRDSTALFGVYLVPLVLVIVLPYLAYYRVITIFLGGTIIPSFVVLLGAIVLGLVLVPTRRIPSIVVFPAMVLAGILGVLVLYFAFPTYFQTIFTGLGYFQQSKLYTTIAEAQRAQLGFVAASFGFFTFLLAFWGFGKAVKGAWKGDAAFVLVAAWGFVAYFMAFAASRFVMNAVPIFSIFIGVSIAALLTRIGLDDVRRRFRSMQGQNLAARSAKSLSWGSALGVALVALFLIVPNVIIGVDASMSGEYEAQHKLSEGRSKQFFGAFGIGFELKGNGWGETMEFLRQQDTHLPPAERPAQIAWWDYGHWAVGIGDHPTVADPFQDHFELAGRFLASESEDEAQNWINILFLNYDLLKHGGDFGPEVRAVLESTDPALLAYEDAAGYDAQYELLSSKVNGTAVYPFYHDLSEATGKHVGYLAVDIRMWPFGATNSGIFYAPAFLANKNPDDFLKLQIQAGSTTLNVVQYGVDDAGNSYRLKTAKYIDQANTEWVIENGYAYRPGATPNDGFAPTSGIPLFNSQQNLVPTQKFQDSMFRRAYGGPVASMPAGDGLTHWRVVQQTINGNYGFADGRMVALLQYYEGVAVTGRVVDTGGQPLSDVEVTFIDGAGASHGSAFTGADGRYTISAPFSQDNDLKLVVRVAGQPIAERSDVQFTPEEARTGASRDVGDIVVQPGNVAGVAYEDRDGTAGFNASSDLPLSGALVSVGGRTATTAADGSYNVTGVQPGQHVVSVSKAGYSNGTQSILLMGGQTWVQDVALALQTSPVTVRFQETNGTGIGQVPMTITGGSLTAARTLTTNSLGNQTTSLPAGTYHVHIDHNATVNGVAQHYVADQDFTVVMGGEPMTVIVNRQP